MSRRPLQLDHAQTRRLAWLAAAALVMIWGFWGVPLVDVDEGAFAEATREMVASGNYVSIQLNGEPRTDKPILIYWAQAAAVHLFGVNEFAFRLPSVIATLLWMAALYRFGARQGDRDTATVAALLFALSLAVGLIARAATADALLNLFIALAMFDIYRHFENGSRALRLRIALWLGLGFLTKGPIAVAIPLLVSGGFYLSYRRGRDWLRSVSDPVAVALFLAVVVPWHVAVWWDSGMTFLRGFYLQHNLGRYSEPLQGHSGGPLYYLWVAPLAVMPFAVWLVATLRHLGRVRTEPLDRYLWLWFFVVLALFSGSGTKLPHYLLYGMSGLFLLMARARAGLRHPWLHLAPVVVLLLLAAWLPQVFAALAARTGAAYEHGLFAAAATAFAGLPQQLALLLCLVAGLVIAVRIALWQRLVLLGFVQAALLGGIIAPTVIGVLQNGPKAAAQYAREHDKGLVSYRAHQPSLGVYLGQVVRPMPPGPNDWIYTRTDRLEALLAQPAAKGGQVVFSDGPATLVAVGSGGGEP